MGWRRLLVLVVILVAGGDLTGCSWGARTAGFNPGGPGGDGDFAPHAPGEVLVRVFPNADRRAVASAVGGTIVSEIARLDVLRLRIGGLSVREAIRVLTARRDVLYAEPNYLVQVPEAGQRPSARPSRALPPLGVPRAQLTPNDPAYPDKLWGLVKINAPTAWDTTTGGGNVVVAVLDTGVDGGHPDLEGKVLTGANCVYGTCYSGDTADGHGHGTHVAGTAGAIGNNGQGVVGVAFNQSTQILPVKVLDDFGSGTAAGVAAGIVWAADQINQQGKKGVLNMSLGGFGYSQVMQDAVAYANASGNILVVAAMGNAYKRWSVVYPAALTGVMAVGATDGNDEKVDFSNTGLHISVGAPGLDIYSTIPGGEYAYFSGTSMSAPHVAGLIGLVWSAFPGWNSYQVRRKIEITAQDLGPSGWDESFGWGRIRADLAVTGGEPPPFYGCAEITVQIGTQPQGGADVIMTQGATRRTSKTDDNGVVRMDFLPVGTYTVTASAVIGDVGYYGTGQLTVTGAGAPSACNSATITMTP